MDNQTFNPYGRSNYYGNDDFYVQNYDKDYLDERNHNQGFNVGTPQPMTLKQLKYLTLPEVVSKSFLFMFVALLITAFAAFSTSRETALDIATTNSIYILAVVELIVVLISNYAIRKNSVVFAGIMYVIYSYIMGVLTSVIFLVYDMPSVTSVFLITAAIFAIMAIYGMMTKRDLSSAGNICLMGIVGIIVTTFVNAFILKNSGLDFIITCAGVLIFIVLTACNVQNIKNRANNTTGETVNAMALFGGFSLYLNFVNMFLRILRIFGYND